MAGIGFAEEPLVRNKSFGEIRSQILAEVYQTLIKSDNPNFSPKSCFDKTCLEHHVNPKNPAFNLSQDPTEFTKLKARTD
ncbi:hypothetical protein FJ208_01540 [Candidatus Gribaldobacteria bacterium]|nr:hypothetical protein [Candidatus Gribaldobacteria bacterium]